MNLYAALLAGCPRLGSRSIRKLVSALGSEKEVWHAPPEVLGKIEGLRKRAADSLLSYRRKVNPADMGYLLEKFHISVVSFRDPRYPSVLAETNNPPACLFYQGILPDFTKAVSIVGSRKCTSYGKETAKKIAASLAVEGVVIISGGARGIDSAAHEGALSAGGKTAVVAACGLDHIYPPENKDLFQTIIQSGGAVLSEYAPGTPPLGRQFPARNRIIAGLGRGTLVVEAAERSGSLITSDFALEEGRDVFAIPGNIWMPMSKGTNQLIRNGAICCTSAADIMSEYGWQKTENKKQIKKECLSSSEKMVLEYCRHAEVLSPDDMIAVSGLSLRQLMINLLQLELKGYLVKTENGKYRLAPGA